MNSLISGWLCINNCKNLFIKVVYPGGRIELYDQPIVAAELLSRNPKCCVAHPSVFHQPYEIVAPTATLALGHKYFVVPISTIRRLRHEHSCHHQLSTQMVATTRSGGRGKDLRLHKGRHGCKGVGKRGLDHHWQPGLESIVEE